MEILNLNLICQAGNLGTRTCRGGSWTGDLQQCLYSSCDGSRLPSLVGRGAWNAKKSTATLAPKQKFKSVLVFDCMHGDGMAAEVNYTCGVTKDNTVEFVASGACIHTCPSLASVVRMPRGSSKVTGSFSYSDPEGVAFGPRQEGSVALLTCNPGYHVGTRAPRTWKPIPSGSTSGDALTLEPNQNTMPTAHDCSTSSSAS